MTEHRQNARAPIELEVTYQRLNSFFADYTRNLSKGGIFVRTARPFPVGTQLVFRLKLPAQAEPLELTGEVVHAIPQGDDAGMGLRFVWADEVARAAFEEIVDRLMTDSLGARAASELLRRKAKDAAG